MSWAPEDYLAVADAAGLGKPHTIYPWPERPHLGITVDMRPITLLAVSGGINNPYLTRVMRAMREASARAAEIEADGETASVEWYELQDKVLDYHDTILGTIIKDPPWCPKADVPSNGITPGRLNIYMLGDELRRMLVNTAFEGPSSLGTLFRPLTERTEPTPDGTSLRTAAEPVAAETAAASSVLAGPGGMVRFGDGREPGRGDARAAGGDAVA